MWEAYCKWWAKGKPVTYHQDLSVDPGSDAGTPSSDSQAGAQTVGQARAADRTPHTKAGPNILALLRREQLATGRLNVQEVFDA